MSANWTARQAKRLALQALNRPIPGGGGSSPTSLAGLEIPSYDDSADVPINEFGYAVGELYVNIDGTVYQLTNPSPEVTSGTDAPNGVVTGNVANQTYHQIAADGLTIITTWVFLGTVGTDTGWVTYA